MECIEKGHVYKPTNRTSRAGDDAGKDQTLTFINKQPGQEHDGTTTQEVLRILLDRTRHCANCMPHPNNERIIWHLRMALVLHEARALERKVDKGDYEPEYQQVGDDGHFMLTPDKRNTANHTLELIPHRQDWDRQCNHPASKEPGHG